MTENLQLEREFMSISKVKFSLVVPMRNELENIPEVINKSYELINNRTNLEVIIVDNGSTDGSDLIFAKFYKVNYSDRMKLVKKEKNTGYGDGIIFGASFASGDWLGWTHGDLQTDLNDTLKAIEIAETLEPNQFVLVKGKRSGRPPFDKFTSFFLTILNYLINRVYLQDMNGQPNWMPKDQWNQIKGIPSDSTFELNILTKLLRGNCMVLRFPVLFPKRINGTGANERLSQKISFTIKSIQAMWNVRRQNATSETSS